MMTHASLLRRQALALLGLAPALPALAQAPAGPTRAFPPMPPAGRRPWADQVREIRIGLLTDENQADRLARTRAYRELIAQHFQVPTRIYEAADYNGVVQGFSARQLEISGMGALVYARIWIDTNGNVEPLVTALNEDGVATYLSVMYVRADSPIRSLDDMRGKSLAWSDPNSTSGFLVPRSELREAGIDINTYFSRTGFAGGQEQGVVAVLNRQYDAGVTATSAEGKATTLTRNVSIVYKGVNLVVRVKGSTAWLKVWVDGKIDDQLGVAGSVVGSGKTLTFTGKESIEVRTGSSGVTYFTLNGTSLGALGPSGMPETWLFAPPAPPEQTQRR